MEIEYTDVKVSPNGGAKPRGGITGCQITKANTSPDITSSIYIHMHCWIAGFRGSPLWHFGGASEFCPEAAYRLPYIYRTKTLRNKESLHCTTVWKASCCGEDGSDLIG